MIEPISRVFDLLNIIADRPQEQILFTSQCNNQWRHYTMADYIYYSSQTSLALLEMGVVKGDRIVTLTQNRAEFNFVDMGVLQIGAVHVPLSPNIASKQLAEILTETDPKILFISNKSVYRKIPLEIIKLKAIKLISFDKIDELDPYEMFIKTSSSFSSILHFQKAKNEVIHTDPASIIYLSGHQTPIKGVVLSHQAHVFNFINFSHYQFLAKRHRAVSFLPLAHSFERTMNYVFQYINLPIVYSESFSTLPKVIQQFSPDVMVAVPLLLERYGSQLEEIRSSYCRLKIGVHQQIARKLYVTNKLPSVLKKIFLFYLQQRRFEGINALLGNKLKLVICGGCQLEVETLEKFWRLGIEVYEGYGLTEAGPVVSVNDWSRIKAGSVGLPMNGVEITTDLEKEILVKGKGLMSSYFATHKSAIDEKGWLHTGDLGEIDKDGFLTITGTKKCIFKLKNGLYINPENIEKLIQAKSSYIQSIWVYGYNKYFLIALIIPTSNYLEDSEGINSIHQAVTAYNSHCDKYEQIKTFKIVNHEWNIENGFLNNDLTLNRQVLQEKYISTLIEIYNITK